MSARENVWDYPRPPRLESTGRRLVVEAGGRVIADTIRGYRVLETSHPPTYYIPPEDCVTDLLRPAARRSLCEFKGAARYFDLLLPDGTREACVWSYPDPTPAFAPIKDYLSFYAAAMDRCLVDGEAVQAQAGSFYGGWVTSDIEGPFKGGPGTAGW
ncbi:MAG: DUF427 domain-containing protein [Alphaproteobacteria bacterium]|jgi:uncharacterized protein (DUF427 family)|nr:DUF427 domain-containing protein [Alphaproteobacteria bacterium]